MPRARSPPISPGSPGGPVAVGRGPPAGFSRSPASAPQGRQAARGKSFRPLPGALVAHYRLHCRHDVLREQIASIDTFVIAGLSPAEAPRLPTSACPRSVRRFTPSDEKAPFSAGFSVFQESRDIRATRPLLQPLAGTVRAFGRWSGLLCRLLTSAPRSDDFAVAPVPKDTTQISWGKPFSLPRTPAGFTAGP